MRAVMYIFANKGLGMSPGKMAAQVAHAAVEAFRISEDDFVGPWLHSGYTKLVMEARNTEHMMLIEKYLEDKGVRVTPIIDEGRTETAPQSFTALGVEIVDKEHPETEFIFSGFSTFKAPKRGSRKQRLREAW